MAGGELDDPCFNGSENMLHIRMATLLIACLFTSAASAAPFLGIYLQPPLGDAPPAGARVHFVIPGSPAAQAGFQRGDLVVKVGDQEIADPQSLIEAIQVMQPGDEVTVAVQRDDQSKQLRAVLGDEPIGSRRPIPRPPGRRPMIGIGLQRVTPDGQLRVADIMPGSPAEKAQLKRGDVLAAIDGQEIDGYRMLVEYVLSKKVGDEVALSLLRDGQQLEVKLVLSAFAAR